MFIVQLSLERIAEHDLGDPHKSGLIEDLAEVRIADCVCIEAGPDGDAVEQVQHFDFHHRCLALTQSEDLHKRRINILLRWRADSGNSARRCAETVCERGAKTVGADPLSR